MKIMSEMNRYYEEAKIIGNEKMDFLERERIKKKEATYRIALYMGEIFLRNGGQTHKLESMVQEFCKSQGFRHANIYITPTFMCIGDDRADGITFIKNIKVRGVNLKRISLINTYYEELLRREKVDPRKALKTLKRIDKINEYSDNEAIFWLGVASVAFVALFNVTIKEAIATFFICIIANLFSSKIRKILKAGVLGDIIACFFIGISSFILAEHGYIGSSHKIIIGSILPFLPGVAITKSVADLVYGDYISGGARAIEAFLSAMSIGIGIGIAMNFWVKMGGKI